MSILQSNWRVLEGPLSAAPEEVHMDSRQLNKLDQHFQGLMSQKKIQAASYLVAHEGKIAAWRSMGTLHGTTGQGELQPDSLRKLSSITKAFTSVSIVKLIEDGKLYIDQPVATILDEFNNPMHQGITLFHLLTHTSGIMPVTGYYNEPYPREWWGAGGTEDWIVKVLQGPVVCEPGEAYNYSTVGFALLGEIISRISGQRYEDYVIEHILQPLGMSRTFFDVPSQLHPEVCTVDERDVTKLTEQYGDSIQPPRSDSGLYSSLYDLWRFGQMLLDGGTFEGQRILGRKSVELLTRRHLFNVPAYHWGGKIKDKGHALGLDLAIDHLSFESPGTFQLEGAGRSGLFVDPVEKLVVVLFVPSIYSWIPESILGTKQIIWSSLM
ncbi:beta-lactamase family protein [Paenibacillus sp. N3/727]|uniref:serine hydrolase domain-containing protein n=1 Tax=Paenibacillus sp. N3/727 TaxID=2925845 RepID=UPI001F5364EF|nr:serine hydrolase domain-containing protein [Paenibacillus sp. N3/727]UNK18941.1 beta-lactamase family protein [Paenibacillus sp. N3/727]